MPAFPNTSLLSSFAGPDEDPMLEGGLWNGSTIRTATAARVPCSMASHFLRRSGAGGVTVSESVFATQYGPVQESWITITTVGSSGQEFDLSYRVTNEGTSTVRCIQMAYEQGAGTANWNWYWLNNITFTLIGSASTQLVSSGDSIGGRVDGNTYESWYKPAAGSWTLLGSVSDANVQGAGKLAATITGTVFRMQTLGGGTPATYQTPHRGVGIAA